MPPSRPLTPRFPHLFDVLGLVPGELESRLGEYFSEGGHASYRVEQVRRWIYRSSARSFDDMENLPLPIRRGLAESFFLREPILETVSRSTDGTCKHLWRLSDGEVVESVLIPEGDRLTLCLSSQVGCALGCTFCATGWAGFSRHLTAGEIVGQYRAAARWSSEHSLGRISNVVYMGMGEPLANGAAVHASLSTLNQGFALGARKITVSTVGLIPGIRELAARREQFGLALSLHAPVSDLRRELIPLEKRYPLPDLMEALADFRATKGRRVTFEYTMIAGINDAEPLAPKLGELARRAHAFVNLIPYNPIPFQDWRPSPSARIEFFRTTLEKAGVSAAVRAPRGLDIEAACGQLRANAIHGSEGHAREVRQVQRREDTARGRPR